MEEYNDFLKYLNDSMVKLKELTEKITTLHNEAATALLETCSLYNPQVLLDLTEMEECGKQFDRNIIEVQGMRNQLETLLSSPIKSVDEYKAMLEDIGIIKDNLSSKFNIHFKK